MKDVTPKSMACAIAASCPAIYEYEDGHLIVGKIMIAKELQMRRAGRVGDDETVVWVPKGLVKPDAD